MTTNKYKHLQESIRIEIAIGYIQHEMRKILPNIREKKIWAKIDKVYYSASLSEATHNSPKNFNLSSEEFISLGPIKVHINGGICKERALEKLYSQIN